MDTAADQLINTGYFVTDAAGQKVEVCFEMLTADELDTLNGDDWRAARFGEVWKQWAEYEIALKLVRCDGIDSAILGIVKLGTVTPAAAGRMILRDSLLETAPAYQFVAVERRYHGVGRVLVARLVVESKAQGAQGRVLVLPAEGSKPFYHALGFQASKIKLRLKLEVQEAEALLLRCTFPVGLRLDSKETNE